MWMTLKSHEGEEAAAGSIQLPPCKPNPQLQLAPSIQKHCSALIDGHTAFGCTFYLLFKVLTLVHTYFVPAVCF